MNDEGTTFFPRAKNIQISVRISMALFIPLGGGMETNCLKVEEILKIFL